MTRTATVPETPKSKGGIALRTAIRIMQKWGATVEQIQATLRISRSTRNRACSGVEQFKLDTDQMTRISLVLNIHAALRSVFDNPENVYSYPGMPNHNEFFDGDSPLALLSHGELIPLYETYRRIESLKFGGW